jgi:predicted RNase H-like HicB family nuclease
MEGPFRILGFPGPDDPDVVYLENQAGSGRGVPRRDQGGYGVWSPDLPGVVALGDTQAEALDEMRRAIEFHLDGLREDGQPIPQPSTV